MYRYLVKKKQNEEEDSKMSELESSLNKKLSPNTAKILIKNAKDLNKVKKEAKKAHGKRYDSKIRLEAAKMAHFNSNKAAANKFKADLSTVKRWKNELLDYIKKSDKTVSIWNVKAGDVWQKTPGNPGYLTNKEKEEVKKAIGVFDESGMLYLHLLSVLILHHVHLQYMYSHCIHTNIISTCTTLYLYIYIMYLYFIYYKCTNINKYIFRNSY